ncbi:MAG: hypothetical protein JXN10_06620 [Clostridia bacterium]|nr:hypothetical protein [Clostridia bacterium]
MKPGITAYINDIVWDIRIDNPMGNEIKRQVVDIFSGVSQPVFSSSDNKGVTVIVGSPDIDIKGLGKDDHIIKTDGKKIHISGGSDRGTAYGIFSFLEEIGFYFLASQCIKPHKGRDTEIPEINKKFTTKNTWRGMFISFCMVSTSIMSLVDYEKLFDNMLRMKMNRIIFYSFENEPVIDYTYNGERKVVGDISRPESGFFSYGRNWTGSYYTDEIKIGKEEFERRKVAPMEFQDIETSDQALDRGKEFMQSIIKLARQRGIGVWISFLPQFTAMNISKFIKPMPRKNLHWSALVSCTDKAVSEINKSRIKNIVESYKELEGIFIGIPEGFYDDPYQESQDYINREFPHYQRALQIQEKYWGDHWPGSELQEKHIRADIGFSKVAVDTINNVKKLYPGIKLGLLTVCKAYLLTTLHRDLPKDITFCDIESRSLWTHGGAPLFLFKEMMGRECSIIPRITDDGSQAGMQFNLKLYHMDGYCRSTTENGTAGLMMQTLYIKGADHNIKYLSEGLWNTEIHPVFFYKKYIKRVYGRYFETLYKAYELLEDNEILMGGRGASNMPWNHLPPEIALMRNLQSNENPMTKCPVPPDYLGNAIKRAEIYSKTIGFLDEAEKLFMTAKEEGADKEECLYMAHRTKAYSKHLAALVELVFLYSDYYNIYKRNPVLSDIEGLVKKAAVAENLALESARLFSSCITHVTDLAILWMVNSSMVKGTEVLCEYFKNLYAMHSGKYQWEVPDWTGLFGECPYPAHTVTIGLEDKIYEPG